MPAPPASHGYRTAGGYEVSTPNGRGDCVIIKRGGAVVFEIVLGGPNVKLVTPGNLEISAGGSINITAGTMMNTTVGAVSTTTVGGGMNTTVGGAMNTSCGSNGQLTVGGRLNVNVGAGTALATADLTVAVSRQAAIDSGNVLTVKSKKIGLHAETDVQIQGKDILIEGSGDVKLKASKDIVLKGQKIAQN